MNSLCLFKSLCLDTRISIFLSVHKLRSFLFWLYAFALAIIVQERLYGVCEFFKVQMYVASAVEDFLFWCRKV